MTESISPNERNEQTLGMSELSQAQIEITLLQSLLEETEQRYEAMFAVSPSRARLIGRSVILLSDMLADAMNDIDGDTGVRRNELVNKQPATTSPYVRPTNNNELSWQQDASCQEVDPDIFFSDSEEIQYGAKTICSGCPVLYQCLEYSFVNKEEYGIWGGLSKDERKKILRRQFREARQNQKLLKNSHIETKDTP